MARGGHRVASAATKAKISASLRGNKNAYRGGPKKRLTAREKVANINARTKANKVNLSDAQIRQRSAVAKRLRARARIEETNGNPLNSKGIPKPNTIEKRDVEVKENVAISKGKIAKVEKVNPDSGLTRSQELAEAALTRKLDKKLRERKTNTVAQMQNGKGNFSKKETARKASPASSGKNSAAMKARVTQMNNDKIAELETSLGTAVRAGDNDRANSIRDKIKGLEQHNHEISQIGKRYANRTPFSKDVDPRVKSTAKPRPLPKASGSSSEQKRGAEFKKYMGKQPMIVQEKALDVIRAFAKQHNLGDE